jgi:amino acid adenylation domain-containing protein
VTTMISEGEFALIRDSAPTTPVAMLRQHTLAWPHAPAVVGDNGELTFAQLWESVQRIATRLHGFGIGAESCVGLYLDPSVELVQGVWGVLAAGAGYLPLSPDYPPQRVAFMAEESQVPVILTTEPLAAAARELAPAGTRVVVISQILGEQSGPQFELRPPDGPSTAYTIFTSGSTGRPKGVVIEHRAIAHQMQWISDSGMLRPGARILQKTPSSFDAAQWEILAPACGATVVIPAAGVFRDVSSLIATVRRHQVSALQCVPTLWRALAEDELLGTCNSLTDIYSGGEQLTAALAEALHSALPAARLINLYGPTEATINATWQDVTSTVRDRAKGAIPLGLPVAETELLLLDQELREVSGGETGELYIGGPQLARGYLNNPELTENRFIQWTSGDRSLRLYRTGDLVRRDEHGSLVFVGRVDQQVKVNGHRIELDEVRLAITEHDWVRDAVVVPWTSARTGTAQLAAFVELDSAEAALMDGDQAGEHHHSKQSRRQVRAQLSNLGLVDADILDGLAETALPGAEASEEQTAAAFRRKSYRFYRGDRVDRQTLISLLTGALAGPSPAPAAAGADGALSGLTSETLGQLLRWFGPFSSKQRLLPKYTYASPGALNATQIYLEAVSLPGLEDGLYYFHPLHHSVVRMGDATGSTPRLRFHLVGKRSAILSVYSANVDEVLHFEAGHMMGVLDRLLPQHGLSYTTLASGDGLTSNLPVDPTDHVWLAGADLTVAALEPAVPALRVRVLVQAHAQNVTGLAAGLYEFADGDLLPLGSETIRRKDVVAINQQAFDRAGFGVSLLSADRNWAAFVELGRALHRLQDNEVGIGLMSSGYSSLTGRDLPTARRLQALLGEAGSGTSYFAIGGPVSSTQLQSRDMSEDQVHMRGPAEILKEELRRFLPAYMLPARVEIVDRLPRTANGKCDATVLAQRAQEAERERVIIAPRTTDEARVLDLWSSLLNGTDASVDDNFFVVGGNSMIAVPLIHRLNEAFGADLPVLAIFDLPTPALLAATLSRDTGQVERSRFIRLADGAGAPIYAWPGLGGFPMNLRALGQRLGLDRPLIGIQACGVNPGETPYPTIEEMAAADIEHILAGNPQGPISLLGYSFGARVAFEAAAQLERAGHAVDRVVLVAPGSPRTELSPSNPDDGRADFDDAYFVQVLLSVFIGTVEDQETLADCRAQATDLESFCAFMSQVRPELPLELIEQITRVVLRTFKFRSTFSDLGEQQIQAPITLIKATGDDYSFIEGHHGYAASPPRVHDLDHDHYSILNGPGLDALAVTVREALAPDPRSETVPHLNIKHFPKNLDETVRAQLVEELTEAVSRAFECPVGVISIALEPVTEQDWAAKVYEPEIIERQGLLAKAPEYSIPTGSGVGR